ncbi:MAG: type II pantothenate kinase [Oscillospiraceae bacterium]|nr:type II pantothenate kinase [Oscillospiraceae bacterium]
MKCILGIDIGGSTTKIIGYRNGEIFSPLLVKANDPTASLYGAFGKFLSVNHLAIDDIERVMITGVGASAIQEDLFGIPTVHIDEFQAIGRGGLFLSSLDHAVVVSMGTGTAFVAAKGKQAKHLGGTGVGGGTLLGLSDRIINVRHFNELIETAKNGDLQNVDLLIRDISTDEMETLTPNTTASNFGKISDLASNGDLALGIINLVFQTIGVISVFAARIEETENIVLTGNLTNVPQMREIFAVMKALYGKNFVVPEHSEFATATGAALLHNMEEL